MNKKRIKKVIRLARAVKNRKHKTKEDYEAYCDQKYNEMKERRYDE